MNWTRLIALAALSSLALLSSPAVAKVIFRPTAPTGQAFEAELIVVGKVQEVEKDLAKVSEYPGGPKVPFQIVSVKVSETLGLAKGLTHVRIGFVPKEGRDADRRFEVIHNLVEGQEGCFFLMKHPEADFYVQFPNGSQLLSSQNDYYKQLGTIKKITKALSEPLTALKAKDAADRQITACALVMKYRSHPEGLKGGPITPEPIPAEESKLILTALSEMEWGQFGPEGFSSLDRTFWMLGLKASDGWTPPPPKVQNDPKLMTAAVTKWLKENAEKYRIQRMIVVRSMK